MTKTVRTVSRTPIKLAYMEKPVLIRLTDYKSNSESKYKSAFRAVFQHVWELMQDLFIMDGEPSEE